MKLKKKIYKYLTATYCNNIKTSLINFKRGTSKRLFLYPILIILTTVMYSFAISNPYVGNPIGPATVPQSNYQNGLVDTTNPIDYSSDLIISGNVSGGKHFQGNIPYNSTSSFEGRLGTSSLDSFKRSSTGIEDIYSNTGTSIDNSRPFYSETKTVTTSRPNTPNIILTNPPRSIGRTEPLVSNTAIDTQGILSRMSKQNATNNDISSIDTLSTSEIALSSYSANQPLSNIGLQKDSIETVNESDKELNRLQATENNTNTELANFNQEVEKIKQRFKALEEKTSQLKQGRETDNNALQPSKVEYNPERQETLANTEQNAAIQRSIELIRANLKTAQTNLPKTDLSSIDEISFGDEPRSVSPIDMLLSDKTSKNTPEKNSKYSIPNNNNATLTNNLDTSETLPGLETMKQAEQKFEELSQYDSQLNRNLQAGSDQSGSSKNYSISGLTPDDKTSTTKPFLYDDSLISGTNQEKGLLSTSQTQNKNVSFTQQKFQQYMTSAQNLIKQNQFLKAADAYTLAAIYKTTDIRVYLGKSHALFAAGDYIGSVFSLSRAINIDPESIKAKIDLVAISGGYVRFDLRVLDLEEYIKSDEADELNLLLAYIYYKIGDLHSATNAIEEAQQKLPDVNEVRIIYQAISEAAGARNIK